MLPRTVQVETGVVRPGIVSDPFISGVDMGRFGVLRLIREMAFGLCSSNLPAALRGPVLPWAARRGRIATETRRSPSGRRARVVTALRGAPSRWLSSPAPA